MKHFKRQCPAAAKAFGRRDHTVVDDYSEIDGVRWTMTIQEQLQIINETFEKLHTDFVRFESEKQGLGSKYAALALRIEEKLGQERALFERAKEDVLKFYRIAKDNSRSELLTSGAAPKKPDLAALNRLIGQINTADRNDPVACKIIRMCSEYVAYLDAEIRKIADRERAEKQRVERDRLSEARTLSQKKQAVLASCERYLRGDDIKKLVRLFESIHSDYEITNDSFRKWGAAAKRKRMMLLGYQQYRIDVPQILTHTLKSSLGKHFDEQTKTVHCPCGFTTDSHEDIIVEYTDSNEAKLKSGIQALILNFLRYFQPTEYKISVFDYYHFNADLIGPLSPLSLMKNGVIEPVPSDSKSLRQAAASLARYYNRVESKIGPMSVFEYNKSHKAPERIPFRMIIINRASELFQASDEPEMLYLLNNAERFGITTVRLTKSMDGGSKGKDREKKYLEKARDYIRVISDASGRFYVENDITWLPFEWLESVRVLPDDFIAGIEKAVVPASIGTKYFTRYAIHTPQKSVGRRKPIAIPFAIDDNDQAISCNFENETFAAYIMGAAGSGKSTLLHTIIAGLLMNYHPDEVELWLLDFKMLEFKRYVDCVPPHVKYILLEKSEDLVFDIVDKMTELLDRRQYIFSQRGWSKLADVPPEENMPAIFVIIDEFAQMSQILRETKGSGYGMDYTIKLENLLAKGRALGFKFIFASQTYTTGISGLTETACKQIQMRFALKNTADEIKQTLTLSSDEMNPELSSWISSIPAYETLFKWRNEQGEVKIGRFRNMYTEDAEIAALVARLNASLTALPAGSVTDGTSYLEKKAVTIDGGQPKTFVSQIPLYKDYEQHTDLSELDEDDILVYAGTPCSFNPARPFVLVNGLSENILIAGGGRESVLSVLLSVFNSLSRRRIPITVWSHERSSAYKRYKATVLSKTAITTDLADICAQITDVKNQVVSRRYENKLIAVFGYEMLGNDMEILGTDSDHEPEPPEAPEQTAPDMSSVMEKIRQCPDTAEKKRILDEYNALVQQQNGSRQSKPNAKKSKIYDARPDLEWVIKRAPNFGVHFVFCFEQARDFIAAKLSENAFQHKILFSMSKDDSLTIMGSRKANEVGDGVCLYSDGKECFTFRPHLYRGVPRDGWEVDGSGKVVRKI